MKINTQRHDVDANGMMNQRKFTVDAGAHIMAVLSGLYKNPVDAMVREYLTNMYDAYVALERARPGSKIIPPTLHLPTALDGNLIFRDNGIGMTLDTVWNVYATYGASTKNGNNDEVGGFGLGSKTAFCYNGGASWTIESRYDGEKHIFMAFIGEDGVPNLSHVTTMPTDEHNGLTISIPIRREDHRAAYDAAKRYVPYFPMAINIEGDTVSPVEYTIRGQRWGIRKSASGRNYGHSEMRVVMGNVPYPVDLHTIRVQSPATAVLDAYALRDFLSYNGIDLWVNIGDVDIVPSRDDLKYTDRTREAIIKAIGVMMNEIGVEFGKQLDACDTEWSAIKMFNGMNTVQGIKNIVKQLEWRGNPISTSTVVAKREAFTKLDPAFEVVRYSITSTDRSSVEIKENPDTLEMSPIDDRMFFIRDDLAKGGATVARALVYQKLVNKSGNGRSYRYGHKIGHAYLVKTTIPNDKLAALFGGMPVSEIQSASVLKGTVPITQAAKATKDTIYRWSGTSWDARVNIPTGTKFYYLPLTKDQYTGRWSFVNNRYGAQKDAVATIKKAAAQLGISFDALYGIKADDTKNFDSSWINLVEAMESEVVKQIGNNAKTFALARMNYNHNWRHVADVFTASGVTTEVADAQKFVTEHNRIVAARHAGIVATAAELRDRIPAIEKKIGEVIGKIVTPDMNALLDSVYTSHPMLRLVVGLHTATGYGNDRTELLKKNSAVVLDYIKNKR